jgi:hypothetical protein
MTLLSQDRIDMLLENLKKTRNVKGAIIEVGVYKGGSLHKIAEAAHDWCKLIVGFDTFEGIPEHEVDIDKNLIGRFSDTSLEEVQKRFQNLPVRLVKGNFAKEGLRFPEMISFAHFDADTYDSTMSCLNFALFNAVVNAIIVLDDYGYHETPGVTLAVHEFLKDNEGDFIIESVCTNQIALRRKKF